MIVWSEILEGASPLCPSDISPTSGGNLGSGFRRNDGGCAPMRAIYITLPLDAQGGIKGGLDERWYEPPASRCARRVPLLLRKKGRGYGSRPLGSGFRRNDGGCAPMRALCITLPLDAQGGIKGGLDERWYEPPASRCARRVPLLLRKKGRIAGCAQVELRDKQS